MKCRCGSVACCIEKKTKHSYEAVVGVRRKYRCKKCGAVFNTVELVEDKSDHNWDETAVFNGGI